MAENGDRDKEDLSEEASPYRLEEMRKKGQVAQSRELTGLLALMAGGLAVYVMSAFIWETLAGLIRDLMRADLAAGMDLSGEDLRGKVMFRVLADGAKIGLPIALATLVVGVAGSYAQVGSIWSTDPLSPDLNKINPMKGIQRFFKMKIVYDALRLTFKAAVVAGVAYLLVKSEVLEAPRFVLGDASGIVTGYATAAKAIFVALCSVLLVFAGIDWWLQRREYLEQARLTKQEAKEEHKEREGNPLIKSRIRSVQREVARRRMMQAVKTADVIVTNPTHIAVALKYDRTKMDAPRVVAKGADFLAQQIKKVAADAGVPIVENIPLARTLHKAVKVGQMIPRNLYQAVAEVLAYVYKLKNRTL